MIFIRNLAGCDVLYATLRALPNLISVSHGGRWVLGQTMCRLTGMLYMLPVNSAELFILVIAVYRIIRCFHPHTARKCLSPYRANILTGLIWLFPLIYLFMTEAVKDTIKFNTDIYICDYTFKDKYGHIKQLLKVLQFIIPSFLIIIANIYLWHSAVRFSQKLQRATKRANIMVLMVSASFILFWFPTVIEEVLRINKTPIPVWFDRLHIYLFFLNVVVNPPLYCATNRSFARFIRSILCFTCMQSRQSENCSGPTPTPSDAGVLKLQSGDRNKISLPQNTASKRSE